MRLLLTIALLGFSGTTATCTACDTPVYRYALERWAPDTFHLEMVHNGPLEPDQAAAFESIRRLAEESEIPLNLVVARADLAAPKPEHKNLAQAVDGQPLPRLTLRRTHEETPGPIVWQGSPTVEEVSRLVDSPARRELVKRLSAGIPGVWVLLDGDDPAANAEADAKLAEHDLSVIRIAAGDAVEEPFRVLLLTTEADLDRFAGQPMAFPVFGRGRALYALVGRGITDRNIGEAVAFLTGPCACEVKADNPGVDLLLAADWEDAALALAEADGPIALASLSEAEAFLEDEDVTPAEPAAEPEASAVALAQAPPPATRDVDHDPDSMDIWRMAGLVVSVLIGIVAAVTLVMFVRRSPSGSRS